MYKIVIFFLLQFGFEIEYRFFRRIDAPLKFGDFAQADTGATQAGSYCNKTFLDCDTSKNCIVQVSMESSLVGLIGPSIFETSSYFW